MNGDHLLGVDATEVIKAVLTIMIDHDHAASVYVCVWEGCVGRVCARVRVCVRTRVCVTACFLSFFLFLPSSKY